ncbi:MAG: M48 family metalloprotease [Planctomycetota bacterium]
MLDHTLLLAAVLLMFALGGPPLIEDAAINNATAWWLAAHLGLAACIAFCVRALLHNRDGALSWPRMQLASRLSLVARTAAIAWQAATLLTTNVYVDVTSAFDAVILAGDLAFLTPVLVVFAAWWWAWLPVDVRMQEAAILNAVDQGEPPPRRFGKPALLWTSIRQNGLFVLVPALLLLGSVEAASRVTTSFLPDASETLSTFVHIGAIAGLFAVIPVVLVRLVLPTQPLPREPDAPDLRAILRLARVRVLDVRVWRTGRAMANAAAVGIIGPIRYVLLTDALLAGLRPIEAEAVVAHEAAHLRFRHAAWMAGGLIVTAAGIIVAGVGVIDMLAIESRPDWVDGGLGIAALLGGVAVALCFSRLFERQADAFAAKLLSRREGSDIVTPAASWALASALLRVARANGLPPTKGSWRHGTIVDRAARLEKIVGTPLDRIPADRNARRAKAAVAVAAIAVGTGVAVSSDEAIRLLFWILGVGGS